MRKLATKAELRLMSRLQRGIYLPFCKQQIDAKTALAQMKTAVQEHINAQGGRYLEKRRGWAFARLAEFRFYISTQESSQVSEILKTLKPVLKTSKRHPDRHVTFIMMAAQTLKKTNPTAARKLVAQARKRLPNQWASWCWGEHGVGLSVMNLAAELGVVLPPPPVPAVAQRQRETRFLRQFEKAVAEKSKRTS
jgi:hypothetical protein